MNLKDVIVSEAVYGETPPSHPMRVAFGVDANYIKPMGVAMTSILETNTGGGY